MSIVLTHQVEATERSAETLLQFDAGTDVRAELETLVECLVEVFAELNRHVTRLQERAAANPLPEIDATLRNLYDLYVRLDGAFDMTARSMRLSESQGRVFAQRRRFMAAWRELRGITSFSPERVAESFAQAQRGETQPLGEFADELYAS